jgi:bacterioferritin (cytochrome b1)
MITWLQRAVAHEFAAARQFTLQSVVARRLGDGSLAAECAKSAAEEIEHAQRFADALAATGASFGSVTEATLPVGHTLIDILEHGKATEASAVRLYRDAARACRGIPHAQALFEAIAEDEAEHHKHLIDMLRARGH